MIGAGWVGAEVAASFRQVGLEVALVDPNTTPMEWSLGPVIGEVWRDFHAANGVELHFGVKVEAIVGNGRASVARLNDGNTVNCDLVVVGVGVVPRTELAARAGIEVHDGVVVDQHLETSVPGVFAAGDVANAYHAFSGGKAGCYGARERLHASRRRGEAAPERACTLAPGQDLLVGWPSPQLGVRASRSRRRSGGHSRGDGTLRPVCRTAPDSVTRVDQP